MPVIYVPRVFGGTIVLNTTTLSAQSVTETTVITEKVLAQVSASSTKTNTVVEQIALLTLARVSETNVIAEIVLGSVVALVVVSETNTLTEIVLAQVNASATKVNTLIESLLAQIAVSITETTAITEVATGTTSSPFPIDTTAQMLYDTLRSQYLRIRSSSTNAHVALMGIVYFPPAQILSEHAIPGELDVLLIGETYSQIHVLRTIDDVTAFLAANP